MGRQAGLYENVPDRSHLYENQTASHRLAK